MIDHRLLRPAHYGTPALYQHTEVTGRVSPQRGRDTAPGPTPPGQSLIATTARVYRYGSGWGGSGWVGGDEDNTSDG